MGTPPQQPLTGSSACDEVALMWPEIHRIGVVQFTLYDVMRGLAIAASLATCLFLNARQGISRYKTLLIAAVCVPVSIGAARLLNAIEYGATWTNLRAEVVSNSGSSIYGALIACSLLVVGLTIAMHMSTLQFLDGGGPAIALGEGISRFGCFCAGCCYGERWDGPWAVVFPDDSFAAMDERRRGMIDSTIAHSLPVHPVQIYGVILMALLTWILIRRFRRPHYNGEIFFLSLIGYGAYRLAITPFRVEVLASMKVFSLLFIAGGLLGVLWSRNRERPV
jgi:phosphatidylglycerol---prolipoprotein diacylglyceryl transferase